MLDRTLLYITLLISCGLFAHWIAWRFKIPALLGILCSGIILGRVSDLTAYTAPFSNLMYPLIAVAATFVMFESGLNLKYSHISTPDEINVLQRLLLVVFPTSIILSSLGAYHFLSLSWPISGLFGVVFSLVSATSMDTILLQIYPRRLLRFFLKLEGLLLEPLGALIGITLMSCLLAYHKNPEISYIALTLDILKMLLTGICLGYGASQTISLADKAFTVTDRLLNPLIVTTILVCYSLGNYFQWGTGYVCVAVLGFFLANQSEIPLTSLQRLKEDIRVLFVSTLLVFFAANVDWTSVVNIGSATFLYTFYLLIGVRIIAVTIGFLGSPFSISERIFCATVVPRGILTLMLPILFVIEMREHGIAYPRYFESLALGIVIVSLLYSSLITPLFAKIFKITKGRAKGLLITGAHPWARELALAVEEEGIKVILVDTDEFNVQTARAEGLDAHQNSAFLEAELKNMSLESIGYMFALTSNDEVNLLATLHFAPSLGRANVYQLALSRANKALRDVDLPGRSRILFHKNATFQFLEGLHLSNASIEILELSEDYTFASLQNDRKRYILPLLIITRTGELSILSADKQYVPPVGSRVICFVKEYGDQILTKNPI